MKYAAALFTIVVVAFAALVSAALDERAYVTVTTLETITSCGPSVTNCPAKSTSYVILLNCFFLFTNAVLIESEGSLTLTTPSPLSTPRLPLSLPSPVVPTSRLVLPLPPWLVFSVSLPTLSKRLVVVV